MSRDPGENGAKYNFALQDDIVFETARIIDRGWLTVFHECAGRSTRHLTMSQCTAV